ncbi:MAG TPA: SDR family oxidoreductase [Firmicutes bacterium]|jgi:meso-butanediol dehydrogenase/(S,S)-butanediol dehydrogenase/diacetyl reductase|nr:SDR family oxidoreductase [Bacillota bacterium]
MVTVNLEGKTAIVTGGANGIGKAASVELAKAGASVVVCDINYEGAQAVAEEIRKAGGKGRAIRTDVSSEDDVNALVNQTLSEFNHIDILVNNAGVSKAVKFIDTDLAQFEKFLNVNIRGVYLCCQAVLPHMMRQNHGKIVNVASIAGREADEFFVVYSATKFAVIGLTQGLAKEMAEYNINVNAVCPGIVRTELWENLLRQLKSSEEYQNLDNEEIWDQFMTTIPMRRSQEPEDIANAIVFLSSDLAKNITGQALNICGGLRPR